MVRVSSCCCGCSLKTGTILIGVFYLVTYVAFIIIFGILLIGVSATEEQNKILKDQGIIFQAKDQTITLHSKNQEVAFQGKGQGINTQEKDQEIDIPIDEFPKEALTIFKVIVGILMAIMIIAALLNVMLIVGAVQEKPKLVFIWFVVHTILLIIDSVMTIVNSIAGMGNTRSTASSIGGTILTILLTVYFLIVVYSYYKELQEKGAPRTPGQPPSYEVQGYSIPPNQMQGYPMQPQNQIQGYPMQPPNQIQGYPVLPPNDQKSY